jgi:hypothetical protein
LTLKSHKHIIQVVAVDVELVGWLHPDFWTSTATKWNCNRMTAVCRRTAVEFDVDVDINFDLFCFVGGRRSWFWTSTASMMLFGHVRVYMFLVQVEVVVVLAVAEVIRNFSKS